MSNANQPIGNDEQLEVSEEANLPNLRYQDQTPIPKSLSNPKRPNEVMSPLNEQESKKQSIDIEEAVENAINTALPKILEKLKLDLKNELQTVIGNAIRAECANLKKEICEELNDEMKNSELRSTLRTLCETEQQETYNRRDNIRVLGINETSREQPEETIKKIISISKEINAKVEEGDISIAHRLPAKNVAARPIIVKFSRRIAKVEIMRKKKTLRDKPTTENVKVFEDITRARVKFLKLMKTDKRIASTWTREGMILYTFQNNDQVYRYQNIFHAASDLGYSFNDTMNCFRD